MTVTLNPQVASLTQPGALMNLMFPGSSNGAGTAVTTAPTSGGVTASPNPANVPSSTEIGSAFSSILQKQSKDQLKPSVDNSLWNWKTITAFFASGILLIGGGVTIAYRGRKEIARKAEQTKSFSGTSKSKLTPASLSKAEESSSSSLSGSRKSSKSKGSGGSSKSKDKEIQTEKPYAIPPKWKHKTLSHFDSQTSQLVDSLIDFMSNSKVSTFRIGERSVAVSELQKLLRLEKTVSLSNRGYVGIRLEEHLTSINDLVDLAKIRDRLGLDPLKDSSELIFNSIIAQARVLYRSEISSLRDSLLLLQGQADHLRRDISSLHSPYTSVRLQNEYQEIKDLISRYTILFSHERFSCPGEYIQFGHGGMIRREFFQKLLTKEGIYELKSTAENYINYKLRILKDSINQAKTAQSSRGGGRSNQQGYGSGGRSSSSGQGGYSASNSASYRPDGSFQLLGIQITATKKEAKQAWIRLRARYQSEVDGGNKAAEEKVKEINNSWDEVRNWFESQEQSKS